jgi:hypothetical protein
MEIDNQQAYILDNVYRDDIIKYENVNNVILNKKFSKEENEQIIYELVNGYDYLKNKYGLSRDQVKRMKNKLYDQYEQNIPTGFNVCSIDDNYLVNVDGKILNRRRRTIVKPVVTKKGYVEFDGVDKRITIHRCVAKTFIDNPENKETVNHIDGVKLNNNKNNLEWNTNAENALHKRINNLGKTYKAKQAATGSKNSQSKLTENKVHDIRNSSLDNNSLSIKYNVSRSTIFDIKTHRSWKHI